MLKSKFAGLVSAAALFAAMQSPALAQQPQQLQPQVPPADITTNNDEFNGKELSKDWTIFHERFGWPNKLKALDVGKTVDGALHIEPYDSGWVRDNNAFFMYKMVEGDFDVRARVRVRGKNGDIPGGTWSLGGLFSRFPNGLTAQTWEPRRENWQFITTGVGWDRGKQMTETKGTFNSFSSLKLRPFASGWVELRMVRVGMTFFVLGRPDGETKWQVRDRFYRMDPNPITQVGLVAYTSSDAVPPGPDNPEVTNRTVNKEAPVDMLMDVDWIRFSKPKPPQLPFRDWQGQVSGVNPLANPNITEAEILQALGD